ncbi:translation elongation factor Ts [Hippea maritima]|uniref:Elongation factor Ts n=1 Tax=Hippea maritima (strain ATCC 700847 / DSM 10411 / MH2) TaxID=760142 RepID=F2LTU1_HIPMA|nr:translation elongation factor Ts [Hippea maritima]AEA34467.1 Elongation factor Ts [Hippea maritima DSM 10411]
MANITAAMVKELRERTGAGMMACKKALQETDGDIEKAIDKLREMGLASAAKKAGREAKEGKVTSYIHAGGKIGVLVEVNCETDFVANTDDFNNLCKDIAMHIAAAAPEYVSRDEIPEDVINKEKEIMKEQLRQEGKPENILDKIVEGKIEKYYEQVCLLEQPFIKDDSMKIKDLVQNAIAKMGENIVVRRFARFKIGE